VRRPRSPAGVARRQVPHARRQVPHAGSAAAGRCRCRQAPHAGRCRTSAGAARARGRQWAHGR
jgi:hypothetical protein